MTVNLRALITIHPRVSDPPRDWVTHTLHFQTVATPSPGDYTATATAIKNIFFNPSGSPATDFVTYGGRAGDVKLYNMADPTPRPEIAVATYTPTTYESAPLAPRDMALCLSFYSDRPNLKRQRGRIYIGPFLQSVAAERVDSTTLARVLGLGHALMTFQGTSVGPGSITWEWCVYSPTGNAYHTITNTWVNDLWDTQRRRDVKESTRVKYP